MVYSVVSEEDAPQSQLRLHSHGNLVQHFSIVTRVLQYCFHPHGNPYDTSFYSCMFYLFPVIPIPVLVSSSKIKVTERYLIRYLIALFENMT